MKEQFLGSRRAGPTMVGNARPRRTRPRRSGGASPVLLEDQIGENTRNEGKRDQHENDCPPQYEEWLTRARELQDQRQPGRRCDECNQPGAGVSRTEIERIIAPPEAAAPRVEERRNQREIELRPMAKMIPTVAATARAMARPVRFIGAILWGRRSARQAQTRAHFYGA